jgi:hypothetical protein
MEELRNKLELNENYELGNVREDKCLPNYVP